LSFSPYGPRKHGYRFGVDHALHSRQFATARNNNEAPSRPGREGMSRTQKGG
jgi:hypothetical protein